MEVQQTPGTQRQKQGKQRQNRVTIFFRNMGPQIGITFAFFVMVVFFSFLSPVFLTPQNLINIVDQTATVSVIAFGMTIVLLSGGIDLSVGSIISLAAVVCSMFLQAGMDVFIAIIASLSIGLGIGLLNGFLVVKWLIQPFLVTLGTMSIARGLSLILTGGRTIYIQSSAFLFYTGRGRIGPISILGIWTIVFFLLTWVLMSQTTFGRRIRAVGGNITAARQAGLRVNSLRVQAFIISGILAAFSGLMLAGRLGSGLPTVGVGMEMNAIAAAVLGGTGFNGEGGSMVGTLFGALIMGTLVNGLTILGVNPYIQEVAKGIIIILAVLVFNLRKVQ